MKLIQWVSFAVFVAGNASILYADDIRAVKPGTSIEVGAETGRMIDITTAEGIADLVRSGDPLTMKVEHVSGHLFVTPLKIPAAELVVIDTRGQTFRINFTTAKPFEARLRLGSGAQDDKIENAGGITLNVMRSLARGEPPEGSVERLFESILFADDRMSLRGEKAYEYPGMIAYRARLENNSDTALAVPLENISLPGLLAIASDDDILQPVGERGAGTTVYLVVTR